MKQITSLKRSSPAERAGCCHRMADKKKGLALQTVDKLNPLMKTVFNSLPSEDGEVDDE